MNIEEQKMVDLINESSLPPDKKEGLIMAIDEFGVSLATLTMIREVLAEHVDVLMSKAGIKLDEDAPYVEALERFMKNVAKQEGGFQKLVTQVQKDTKKFSQTIQEELDQQDLVQTKARIQDS